MLAAMSLTASCSCYAKSFINMSKNFFPFSYDHHFQCPFLSFKTFAVNSLSSSSLSLLSKPTGESGKESSPSFSLLPKSTGELGKGLAFSLSLLPKSTGESGKGSSSSLSLLPKLTG